MADNVAITAGSGTTISTEEITNLNGGAVTAQHGQRLIAAIRTADGTAVDLPGDSANGLDVDVTRSALPTGASTSANQTTIIGHVDGIESSLTTIGGGIGAAADAAATAGGTGSLTAKLRLATQQLADAVTALQRIDDAISGTEMQVDVVASLPAGSNTIGRVDIASALPAGTNAIGKLAANSGVDIGDVDVTSLPALPAGNNNIGDVDVASIAAGSNAIGNVGLIARTSGGASIFRSIDLDETEEDIKTSAGQLYGYYFANLHATSWRYVKLYNATAANVTVGTTTPVLTLPLPPNSAGHVPLPVPAAFATAISAAATTGLADNDTGAPGNNEVVFNAFYA